MFELLLVIIKFILILYLFILVFPIYSERIEIRAMYLVVVIVTQIISGTYRHLPFLEDVQGLRLSTMIMLMGVFLRQFEKAQVKSKRTLKRSKIIYPKIMY